MISIDDFFEYLSIILVVINAGLYAWSSKKYKLPKTTNILTLYVLIACIIQITQFVLAKLLIHNLFLSHFYFILQFILLSLFYKELLNEKQSVIVKRTMFIVLLALSIHFVFNAELLVRFNVFEAFITSLPIIIYAVIHKYNSLSKTYEYKYVNTGILVYLSTSALIFILGDYLSSLQKSDLLAKIWFINKVLYVGFLLLILIEWKVKVWPVKNN